MERKWHEKTWGIILLIILFWPIGVLLFFKNPYYSAKLKLGSVVFCLAILALAMLIDNTDNKIDNQTVAISEQPSPDIKIQEKENKKEEKVQQVQQEKEEADVKINDLLDDIASQDNRSWNGVDMFVVVIDGGILGEDIYMDMRHFLGTRENFLCLVGKSDSKYFSLFKNDKYNFLTNGDIIKVRKDGGYSFDMDDPELKKPTEEDIKIYNAVKKYFTSYANIPPSELNVPDGSYKAIRFENGKYMIKTLHKGYQLIWDLNDVEVFGEPEDDNFHVDVKVEVPGVTNLQWSFIKIPNALDGKFGISHVKVKADNGASRDFYVRSRDRVALIGDVISVLKALEVLEENKNSSIETKNDIVPLEKPQPASPSLGEHWIKDDKTNIYIWNPKPSGNEQITWSGGYVQDGDYKFAEGNGTVTWYRDGKIIQVDEGSFSHGKHHGQFKHTFKSGNVEYSNWNHGEEIPDVNSQPGQYVGTYNSGMKAYIVPGTMHVSSDSRSCNVRIIAIADNGETTYLDYRIWQDGNSLHFSNSEGYSGLITPTMSVENKIWEVARSQ